MHYVTHFLPLGSRLWQYSYHYFCVTHLEKDDVNGYIIDNAVNNINHRLYADSLTQILICFHFYLLSNFFHIIAKQSKRFGEVGLSQYSPSHLLWVLSEAPGNMNTLRKNHWTLKRLINAHRFLLFLFVCEKSKTWAFLPRFHLKDFWKSGFLTRAHWEFHVSKVYEFSRGMHFDWKWEWHRGMRVTPPHGYPCIAKWIIYDYCNMYCTTASRDGKLKHVCVSVHTYP